MRKLILFDIDGTIVSEEKEHRIPDSMYRTLDALKKNGHLCFVNTGRAYCEIDSRIQEMCFDGYICGCGTFILYQGQALLSRSIPTAQADAILQDLEECKLDWMLEGTKHIYYSSKPYKTHIAKFKEEHEQTIPDSCCILDPSKPHRLEYDKFCLCLRPDSKPQKFMDKYRDAFTFIDRKNGFYEVVPTGYSKASGIRFLEKQLALARKDTIAIGDSTNDLPMLEYAGYSIAMGNSAPELLPVVDYVTPPLQKDGVYHAMRKLCLI